MGNKIVEKLLKQVKDVHDHIWDMIKHGNFGFMKTGPFYVCDGVSLSDFESLANEDYARRYGLAYLDGVVSICGDNSLVHGAAVPCGHFMLLDALTKLQLLKNALDGNGDVYAMLNTMVTFSSGMKKMVDAAVKHSKTRDPIIIVEMAFMVEDKHTLKQHLMDALEVPSMKLVIGVFEEYKVDGTHIELEFPAVEIFSSLCVADLQ